MLPEDQKAQTSPNGSPGDAREQTASAEWKSIPIEGCIGTDPEELNRWAAHVVAGKSIARMKVTSLGALVKAIQAHPHARLAPASGSSQSDDGNNLSDVTRLHISDGCLLGCSLEGMNVRISLVIHTYLCGGNFARTTFSSLVEFRGAIFDGWASFENACFVAPTWFNGVDFRSEALFGTAVFNGKTRFDKTTFRDKASFQGTAFSRDASFDEAAFQSTVSFNNSTFGSRVWFRKTMFGEAVSFSTASFMKEATFDQATFSGRASFDRALFHDRTWFAGAHFADRASFDRVTLDDRASFNRAVFERGAWFSKATIRNETYGDLRGCDVNKANAAYRRPLRLRSGFDLAAFVISVPSFWIWRSLRHGWPGWERVRATGSLTIINRVSVITLLAVPILAALYVGLQDLVREQGTSVVGPPWWTGVFVSALGERPHLSASIACAFFASVAISIGLLLYQANAPKVIRKRDEDEHVHEIETRYSEENESLRRDGLRRSIEFIEDQGMTRPGFHPRFVRHHGVLIWMPPGDRPEWFDDKTLPSTHEARQLHAALTSFMPNDGKSADDAASTPEFVPIQDRPGFVPDFERARICIEEGARAEYWLKAHESIFAAWISFVCYTIGILMLLCVVVIQCHNVGRAAGWWAGIDPGPYLRAWFGL